MSNPLVVGYIITRPDDIKPLKITGRGNGLYRTLSAAKCAITQAFWRAKYRSLHIPDDVVVREVFVSSTVIFNTKDIDK